jgi:hypothetical protein
MTSFQCRLTFRGRRKVKCASTCRNYNDFIRAARIDALFEP